MPANEKNTLTEAVIGGLRSTVANGAEIEKHTPGERQFVHTARGRATYMLVTLLEAQPQKDYVDIARLLDGFETGYPWMSANFDEITQWRLQALERTGQYALAEN